MRLNLISSSHSKGLLRDTEVIAGALNKRAVKVVSTRVWRAGASLSQVLGELSSIGVSRVRPFDVNVFVEDIKARWLKGARINAWIPNQEWVRPQSLALMHTLNVALCKTRSAAHIFHEAGVPTEYIGFTSPDRFDASVRREFRALHVAGNSPNKGTRSVIDAWFQNPGWPVLDLVWNAPAGLELTLPANVALHRSPVSEAQLTVLQNRASFHICPSAVEGFGHTVVEAMSCGACVITTDAGPMNELVAVDRGILVPWEREERLGLATAFHVSSDALAAAVNHAFCLDPARLVSLSQRARDWYLTNHTAFEERLGEVLQRIR